MTRADLLGFLRGHLYAVEASVSASSAPQTAVVGIVVTDKFEVFFDTVDNTRKAQNLRANPRIALVIGGLIPGDGRTAQYEGIVDEPSDRDLDRLQDLYFRSFPDGRERQAWPGLIYLRARPTWIRFSDFNQDPQLIIEFDFNSTSVAS